MVVYSVTHFTHMHVVLFFEYVIHVCMHDNLLLPTLEEEDTLACSSISDWDSMGHRNNNMGVIGNTKNNRNAQKDNDLE